MFKLPRAVLGWVSLATDAASQAIDPLLPFFLTRVLSAGAVTIGASTRHATGAITRSGTPYNDRTA